ncbi:MAG TPA: hypothetical protein IAB45_05595 [Candidatus Onthousia faecavium]|nr:hypothetical protein [Candidatus Onthousia faecavium]
MRKIYSILIFVISFLAFFPVCFVNAKTKEYIILTENKYFREKPGGRALNEAVTDGVLLKGMEVDVLDTNTPAGNGCKNNWYQVSYNGYTGYICSSNQAIISKAEVDLEGDFEQEMLAQGFKESYLPYLKALHEKHPNWVFTAVKTGLDFEEAVTNENIGDINVVDGDDESLRSKEYPYYQNGQYIAPSEAGWYVASRNTVSYYLDPRNFLTEDQIFMFENLKYNASIHTREAVESVTADSFLDTDEYLDILMKTASLYNVSPVYLASRIRQEKGNSDSIGTTGGTFTFSVDQNCLTNLGYTNIPDSWNALNSCGSGRTYSGIYNYFNIGAYSSYMSPVIRGLIWANGGYDASVTTYLRPWNTKEKAIMGGTKYIAAKFINANQHTLYYQKFNVDPNSTYATYTNQYMTNVRAHASEALKIYKSYKENNLLNNTYEFLIPVYENMPNDNETILPDDSEEEEITEPSKVAISEGIVAAGLKVNNNTIYGIDYNTSVEAINSKLNSISANLTVTSYLDRNGKAAKGNVGTGDTLIISNGTSKETYKVLIYGDNNGDGDISIVDLLRCQKHLLNSSSLTSIDITATDTNKDGKVDVVDLLRVQKQLLGQNIIDQR